MYVRMTGLAYPQSPADPRLQADIYDIYARRQAWPVNSSAIFNARIHIFSLRLDLIPPPVRR